MAFRFARRTAGLLMMLFIVAFIAACGTGSPTSSGNAATASTPTQTAATPTATSGAGAGFQQFNGTGFSINYPTAWQTSQRKLTNANGQTVYSFVASDQITGLHVALHTTYVDATSPIMDLTNAQMQCDPSATSLPPSVTINGITWYQTDLLCLLASTYYEVRLLTNTNATTKDQTTIVYGAYQQTSASTPFAQANQHYFEPMLQSFRFDG